MPVPISGESEDMDGGGGRWTAQSQPQTSQLSETPRISSELILILGLLLPLWVSAPLSVS